MKVAVLKGGKSLEREVSLRSGARVEDALGSLGYEIASIDVGAELVARLREEQPDVAFIALHGPGGEDGTVQELLEILGIPYTGPGVAACGRCADKVVAKQLFRASGIPTPDWFAFNSTAFGELGAADTLEEIEERLGFPLVIKPSSQGSALGIRFAADRGQVPGALVSAFSYGDRVVLERHVAGRELAVSVIDGEPLPAVEAIPHADDTYSYEARYEIGRTDFVCPAELSGEEAERVNELASQAYSGLGCAGVVRVDLMLGDDGPEVLEVNAVPGMTDTSLLPMAAEAAGLGFEELVGRVIELALASRAAAGGVERVAGMGPWAS